MLGWPGLERFIYCPKDLRVGTLDQNRLNVRCPLDNGHIKRPAQYDVGLLDDLPLEIVHLILKVLDIETLTTFRLVNLRARAIVDELPEYHVIATHVPNLLRGVLSTQCARWMTCTRLFDTLCTADCEMCGDFGGYIYIITCNRVCFSCFCENQAYLPIVRGRAPRGRGIDSRVLATMPYMVSLPGNYSLANRTHLGWQYLVDRRSVNAVTSALRDNKNGKQENTTDTTADRTVQNDQEPNQSLRRLGTARISNGRGHPYDHKAANPLRFLAIVQAPFLDRDTQTIDWGFYCNVCRHPGGPTGSKWRQMWVKSTFATHLSEFHANTDLERWEPEEDEE